MKTRITAAEQQQIADLLGDATHLLAVVADLERRIGLLLGVTGAGEDQDAISDAVAGVLPLAALLRQLAITVEGGNGAARP